MPVRTLSGALALPGSLGASRSGRLNTTPTAPSSSLPRRKAPITPLLRGDDPARRPVRAGCVASSTWLPRLPPRGPGVGARRSRRQQPAATRGRPRPAATAEDRQWGQPGVSETDGTKDPEEVPRQEVLQFVEALGAAGQSNTLVKATFSRYRGKEEHLKSAVVKVVEIKGGPHYQILLRYKFRDVTKNYPLRFSPPIACRKVNGREAAADLLVNAFSMASLFTTEGDWQLVIPKKAGKPAGLTRSKASTVTVPSKDHDRTKSAHISSTAPFLVALGVTDAEGEARPGMARKLRQVDRFCEVLGHMVQGSPLADRDSLRVVDMGAGKGYLTFATHSFLASGGGRTDGPKTRSVITTGVEVRQDMVDKTNTIAEKTSGCQGLSFAQGSIAEWARQQAGADGEAAQKVDVLIALHACDTATDDALFYGINARADVILASPCCHKEIRRQFRLASQRDGPDPDLLHGLQDVVRHGILAERQAELVTDSLRATLLEAAGYKATVFEFVTGEHTSKNLMICAVRRQPSEDEDGTPASQMAGDEAAAKRAIELLKQFGIQHQRLAALMGLQTSHSPYLVSFEANSDGT